MTWMQQKQPQPCSHWGHLTFQLLDAKKQHAGVMQGDAAVAKASPSKCQAADRPGQPSARLVGRPALGHVLQCQPQDCSSGTALLLTALLAILCGYIDATQQQQLMSLAAGNSQLDVYELLPVHDCCHSPHTQTDRDTESSPTQCVALR